MNTKLTALLASIMLLGLASEAMALDGYRDRKGLLYGGHVGAGQIKSDKPGEEGRLGYHIGLKVGGGVSDQLTLDAGFDYRSDDEDSIESEIFGLLIGANYFVSGDFFVRATAGMTTYSIDLVGIEETGLTFGGGVGYEFFANSDLAVGAVAIFQQQTYDDFNIHQTTLSVTATLY